MNSLSRTALYSSFVALLSSTVLGQGGDLPPGVLQGRASSWAAGVIVSDGPSIGTQSQIRIKETGNQTAPPGEAPPQGSNQAVPSYAMAGLHAQFPGIKIDAHSSGNAWIPRLDANGVPDLTDRWLAVTVSVSNTSTGAPNSPWRRATTSTRNAGSELVSYYFDGSVGVSSILVGNMAQESTREMFGFSSTSLSDISALDYGFGVVTEAQAPSNLFPRAGDYFFSVTEDWADTWHAANPPNFANIPNTSTMVRPRGGDIYRLVWNGAVWSSPYLYMTAAELGLDPDSGDVDGLEVSPGTDVVIYSATIGSTFLSSASTDVIGTATQLMIYEESDTSAKSTVRELRHSAGTSQQAVRKRVKLGNNEQNEVDAVCAIDPELGLAFDDNVGSPTTYWGALGRPMGLSVSRRDDPNSMVDDLVFQLTGWGQIAPQSGTVILFKHVGPITTTGSDIPYSGWSYETTAAVTRGATDQVLEIVRPRDMSVLLTPVETSFMALFYNSAGARVGSSIVLTMIDHQ